MKNKKLISLVIVALIISLVMTALIIKNTQANSSESNIASNDEVINEIDDTDEIQSASENITEETYITQENIVLESDTETAPEAETTQVIQEEPKKITNTQKKKIESSKQTQQNQTIQTTTKQTSTQIQVQEQPKQETKTETKVQEPVEPKCSDGKHGVGVGNSNKWFNSYSEAISYYDNLINGYSNQVHSGAITAEEYNEKCPYGYETWSCPYCGKWTLNFYYR